MAETGSDIPELDDDLESDAERIVRLLVADLADGLDHPELWAAFPEFVAALPELPHATLRRAALDRRREEVAVALILAMGRAASGDPAGALINLQPLAAKHTESPLVQGAVFHINGLLEPENPKYQLAGKLCPLPFDEIHVLETTSHLCCATWLGTSAGDLNARPWLEVWNSETAQAIRESLHDGSYRYCNKTACPMIQTNSLRPAAELAARSERWRTIVEERRTAMAEGPVDVNLAYDKTCNLSCPSCRVEKIAADAATRERYDRLQENAILPMLREAKTVFITGSGDPFASKNFRRLIERLGPDDYPDLKFTVMTNGMLLTRREWARFPALHRRVRDLRISIDAATGPTHERLRRGARWSVMLENMRFAGELLRDGLVSKYHLAFTVQTENFREMGDACDLARAIEATGIYFGRLDNWGAFSEREFAAKAVFLPGHPEHEAFLDAMQDPRLRRSHVQIGNLAEFIREPGAEFRSGLAA